MRFRWMPVAVAVAIVMTGCAADDGGDPAPSASTDAPTQTPTATPSAEPAPVPTATAEPAPSEPAPSEPAPSEAAQPAGASGIDDASSVTVVVDKRRPMHPADYAPPLVAPSVAQDGDELIQPVANTALVELDAAMRAEIGEGIHVFSSYRSFARQTQLYDGYVAQYGQAAADTTSARPGYSEHQTGLAMDVVGTGGQCRLDTCFGGTSAGAWIAAEAWRFGYIVRYPDGLEGVTGYEYEPWHIRYVGADVSTAMHDAGTQTLEEHFGLPAAPDYG